MKILGIDFETNTVDPETSEVIEVGMVLWETDIRSPLKIMGYLVDPGPVEWDPVCVTINGITTEMCSAHGYPTERALKQLLSWYQTADAAIAHNGKQFDRIVFKRWCQKFGYDPEDQKLWIDTMTDLPLPPKFSKKLIYMPVDHRTPVNMYPHRAVFDVMTMMMIFDTYPLEEVILRAHSPGITIQADVSFNDKNLAKARGYYWKSERKAWIKDVKECDLEKEKAEAGFPVRLFTNP